MTADTLVTVTLTAEQWDTVRVALLINAIESREKGSDFYADTVTACYNAIEAIIPPAVRTY
ncbi:hypothetical protein EBT31_08055 [bacterium]|nr:hypothetical protein [bacterium]